MNTYEITRVHPDGSWPSSNTFQGETALDAAVKYVDAYGFGRDTEKFMVIDENENMVRFMLKEVEDAYWKDYDP